MRIRLRAFGASSRQVRPRACGASSRQAIVVLTGLFLLCSADAGAQGLVKGVRGGVNLSNQHVSTDSGDNSLDWQVRPVFGGFVTWRMLSWFELQPEVLYSMKGGKIEEFGITTKLLLDYIEAPILGRITRGAPGSRRFYVVFGPSFGVLVRAKARADFETSTEEIDIRDDLEPFDLGVVAGGGIEFGSIVVDGRYTFGLSDTDKVTDVKSTNRAISLTVGFKF
jgi:hypothetical protein